jgi:hypothetical protein
MQLHINQKMLPKIKKMDLSLLSRVYTNIGFSIFSRQFFFFWGFPSIIFCFPSKFLRYENSYLSVRLIFSNKNLTEAKKTDPFFACSCKRGFKNEMASWSPGIKKCK